jgi:glucose-1-phosphate thymidylyltransferase
MRRADVRQCVLVIAEWKLEIARVFGDGSAIGVALAYVMRPQPRGLADALDAAAPWLHGRDVCLALPDTLIAPEDALARVRGERESSGADVVLGVFPTAHPEQLGPVRVDSNGTVIEVLDKPAQTDLRNTWGMAIWSPRFTTLLTEAVAAAPDDAKPVLGAVFQRAIEAGLRVRAVPFADGRFIDVGTSEGIAEALSWSK